MIAYAVKTVDQHIVFPNLRLAVDVVNTNYGDQMWGKFYKRPIVVVDLQVVDRDEWMLTLLGWMENFWTLHMSLRPTADERKEAQKHIQEWYFIEELEQDTECVD